MTSEHKHSRKAWWEACSRLLGIRRKDASDGRQEHAALPRHIAIIMDGNGRWATRQGLPRTAGHKAGVEALREIIRECDHIGIEALSIYAFSTENWKRSAEEVGALM